MKKKRSYFGFTITELILAIAVSSIIVLALGAVMLDTQRGWMDSYAKVHGGATTDAAVVKTAFDKVVRKASRALYHFNGSDDITVYYYDKYATPDARLYDDQPIPEGLTDQEYFLYANVDVAAHRFHPEHAVPWLTKVFAAQGG